MGVSNFTLRMMQNSSQPIGMFDSGIGGLTVAHAVTQLLPNENLIYFGDTAHAPWGDKSTAAIQAYSIKICDMLLNQNCKVVLIACNTGTSAAYDLVKEYVGSRAKVINVIDPVVNYLREKYAKAVVGLIGTRQTVNSNIYKKKLAAMNLDIQLHAVATPLLVPVIEEGFADSKIAAEIIQHYLAHPDLQNIQALILGCTHYPLIKKHIEKFYQQKIDIVDSAQIVAAAVKGFLEYNNLNHQGSATQRLFYVSDFTDAFAASTKLFFKETIELQRYPLWD